MTSRELSLLEMFVADDTTEDGVFKTTSSGAIKKINRYKFSHCHYETREDWRREPQ